jgi:hypothetical protein
MAAHRPHIHFPIGPPPTNRAPDPSGPAAVLPFALLFGLALIIVGLIAIGGWVAFGFALALLIVGVFAMSRWVQQVAWTRRSSQHLRGDGVAGMSEDLAMPDDAHDEISPHDLPPDSLAHRETMRRLHTAHGA